MPRSLAEMPINSAYFISDMIFILVTMMLLFRGYSLSMIGGWTISFEASEFLPEKSNYSRASRRTFRHVTSGIVAGRKATAPHGLATTMKRYEKLRFTISLSSTLIDILIPALTMPRKANFAAPNRPTPPFRHLLKHARV